MKAMQRSTLVMALAVGLILPAPALLADAPAATDGHAAHQAEAAPAPVDMQAMRNRMREIHQTSDPEKRKALIEAQLKDMEAMMRDPNRNCPMADGQSGMGMMGGGMGMMAGQGGMSGGKCGKGMMAGKSGMAGSKCGMGMMGQGMRGGMAMSGQDDMLAKRMEMMEKRMDMMQMMMQMRMQGMGGGMGMPPN